MESGENFAFETTLASRSFATSIKEARQKGYDVTLLFLYLNSPELAVIRVAKRLEERGHYISEEVVKREYFGGLKNLFQLYLPLADNWMVIDNSTRAHQVIAEMNSSLSIYRESELWFDLTKRYGNARK